MPNIEITTKPTGRSPESKVHFGNRTNLLDMSRPKYNKIGKDLNYWEFFEGKKEVVEISPIVPAICFSELENLYFEPRA